MSFKSGGILQHYVSATAYKQWGNVRIFFPILDFFIRILLGGALSFGVRKVEYIGKHTA